MYTFISSEVRVLSSPLTNLGGKYYAFKICNGEKLLWFVQHWADKIPAYIKCFENNRDFEIYWKNLKKHYKDEKHHKQKCCPDVQLYENPFYPF